MNDLESCTAWLDRLDKLTWDYLQTHVAYFDSIDAWTWDSYSQTIEILYTGDAWESKCLTVSLKDLLEWGDEHAN